MNPLRDDELINNPAFHQAVRTHRATLTGAAAARSRRWPIGLVLIAIGVISVILIVLFSLIRLGG
jgi:hypothetical protein